MKTVYIFVILWSTLTLIAGCDKSSSMDVKVNKGSTALLASAPKSAAASLSFTDTDNDASELAGTVTIARASDESDITEYLLYWGSNASTKQSDVALATLTSGKSLTYTFAADTKLPTNPKATHLLVFTKNPKGEMTTGTSLLITDLGLPAATASSAVFSDTDMVGGHISGTITITKASDETTITHYVLYWGSSTTTKWSDTPIALMPATGSNVTYTFNAGTVIPTGATHLLIYTRNLNGDMPTGLSLLIIDGGVPTHAAAALNFTDTDTDSGQLAGTVTITKATVESDLTHYVLYWGSSASAKQSSTAITEVSANGSDRTYNIPANTLIPSGATHLLVYSKNAEGEMATPTSYTIADVGVPANTATTIGFTDTDSDSGELSGTVTIAKAANESDITHYVLYWGSNSTTKQNGTPLSTIAKTGANVTYNLAANTSIPTGPGATHLLVFTRNASGEMSTGISHLFVDSTTSSCSGSGTLVASSCWYYGAAGESCGMVCALAGLTYDPATLNYAGSLGSNAQCKAVMDAIIGAAVTVLTDSTPTCFAAGLGCGYATVVPGYNFCSSAGTATDENSTSPVYRRACACQ